jgi:diphosphomevalonate decarboxylase
VTYKSSPNIALIKYWGKYNEEYILPINDSLGLTLNQDDFHTITTIKFGKQFSEDSLLLNETIYPISKRLKKLFKIVR